jgi:outer membrane protein insertion porin family
VNKFWKNNEIMVIRRFKLAFIAILLTHMSLSLSAQEKQEIVDYMGSNDYIVGGVSVTGVRFLDTNALIGISGLRLGQELSIPGDAITTAAQKLWQQGLFVKIVADSVFLDISLQERPRVSSVKYNGMRKAETDDLIKKINLPVGSQVTAFLLNSAKKIIKDHFIEKGFLNTDVEFVQKMDPDQAQ